MEEYLRKARHMPQGSGGDFPRSLKRFKKFIIIAVVAMLVMAITFVVVIIMLINWLVTRGSDQIEQAGKQVTEQVQQSLPEQLDLQSYITGDQVNLEQLGQAYNALPASLQNVWLDQLNTQINELKGQAGISEETINTLTTWYETLRLVQGG